jgi:hypothetical protein
MIGIVNWPTSRPAVPASNSLNFSTPDHNAKQPNEGLISFHRQDSGTARYLLFIGQTIPGRRYVDRAYPIT